MSKHDFKVLETDKWGKPIRTESNGVEWVDHEYIGRQMAKGFNKEIERADKNIPRADDSISQGSCALGDTGMDVIYYCMIGMSILLAITFIVLFIVTRSFLWLFLLLIPLIFGASWLVVKFLLP